MCPDAIFRNILVPGTGDTRIKPLGQRDHNLAGDQPNYVITAQHCKSDGAGAMEGRKGNLIQPRVEAERLKGVLARRRSLGEWRRQGVGTDRLQQGCKSLQDLRKTST